MAGMEKLCRDAQILAESRLLTAALCVQVIMDAAILTLSFTIVLRRAWRQRAVHDNLKILLANVVLLNVFTGTPALVNRVRLLVLYHTYKEPCDLMISAWESASVRVTFYVYLHAFPLWHLAIAAERAWATLKAENYGRTSAFYGGFAAILVWVVSVGYVAALVVFTVSDDAFRPLNYYVSFSAGYATQLVFYGHFVLLGLELLSAAVDVALMVVNRQKLTNVRQGYSLSRSYQLTENITVTLNLVLPLNICNSALYTVFVALSVWIRGLRNSVEVDDFHSTFEWINLLPKLQMLLSLLILLRFSKRVVTKVTVVEHNLHANLYFQQFQKQIA